MSKKWIPFLPSAIGLSLLATGCSHSDLIAVREPPTKAFPTGELLMAETFPAPKREYFNDCNTITNQAHFWVAGGWMQVNGRWVWTAEHWE